VHGGLGTILDCWRGEYGLEAAFDSVIEAPSRGLLSRDPDLYGWVVEEAGCAPEECVLVDSTLRGVEAAEKAGVHGYRYGTAYGLRLWMEQIQEAGRGDTPR
jgi:FMN phosphatase YigB (HAD superfamily)